jgi:hypothetical protein
MKYIVCVTDGHHFRDIEIETDQGVEEACLLAIDRATETQQWEIVETFEEGAHCSRCDGETRFEGDH